MAHVSERLPPFKELYDFLCEVAHPNTLGLIKAYVKNDWESGVSYFGKEQGQLGSHLESDLQNFMALLEAFMSLYSEVDFLFLKLKKLRECEVKSP